MPIRPLWFIANWKMHGSQRRVQDYAYTMNAALSDAPAHVRYVFCPPVIYLAAARQALPQNARLSMGAQDAHAGAEGAFTGDIAAAMLKDSGAEYVILGHSERRQGHRETDAEICEKVASALTAGLTPIVCIGETLQEYEARKTPEALQHQLQLLAPFAAELMIAYEPVWAIGSGKTPRLQEIEVAHTQIKSLLGSATPVLYGGSVKPENSAEILALPTVDGVLVGGASLNADAMRAMLAASLPCE